MSFITGIAHVNLTVPPGTLEAAAAFYEGTLGFTRIKVPVLQKDTLAWFVLLCFTSDSLHFIPECLWITPTPLSLTVSIPRL